MDRNIVYASSIPQDVDILSINRNAMIGLGMLCLDVLGSGNIATGLLATATSPASLNISVGPGRFYSLQNVDNTAYGSLPVDTTHQILKQGILFDPATLSCPAPATFGFSVNFLIEASYQDFDTNQVALPYYNSANPTQAFSGPGNNGTPQATARNGTITLRAKAGAAASTGTQVTPAPDAGFVGLWVVTVANGQTTITSANISVAPGAPFLNQSLLGQLQATRIPLTTNTTFFVSPTGSNSNTGLSSSSPWLTVQNAINVLASRYDLNGFIATIVRANGTYTESVTISGPMVGQTGAASLVITGSSSASVIVNSSAGACYQVNSGGAVTIQNHKLTNSGGDLLAASDSGQIVHQGCNFGASTGSHCDVSVGGLIVAAANYTISGGGTNHLLSSSGGAIALVGFTVTITGTPAFSDAFATATRVGFIQSSGATFSGAATGGRYSARVNGAIDTSAGGANYFPGNSAGTTATGGQYI